MQTVILIPGQPVTMWEGIYRGHHTGQFKSSTVIPTGRVRLYSFGPMFEVVKDEQLTWLSSNHFADPAFLSWKLDWSNLTVVK